MINEVTVRSTDPDVTDTASAQDTLDVDPDATLSITKAHLGPFIVGQNGSYDITIGNTGPTATPGPVVMTDQLPAGLTFVSAAGAGWACTATGTLVSCTYGAPLCGGGLDRDPPDRPGGQLRRALSGQRGQRAGTRRSAGISGGHGIRDRAAAADHPDGTDYSDTGDGSAGPRRRRLRRRGRRRRRPGLRPTPQGRRVPRHLPRSGVCPTQEWRCCRC